jgi:hypothetical protein
MILVLLGHPALLLYLSETLLVILEVLVHLDLLFLLEFQ